MSSGRSRTRRADLSVVRALAPVFLTALVAPLAGAQVGVDPITSEYLDRDNIEGSFINLATFPVRPMALDGNGNVWAVNNHDSTVVKFGISGGNLPDATYPVPWNPVSVALYSGANFNGSPEMLVVCRGTWTIVGLDLDTGEITRVLQLRPGAIDDRIGMMSEPADIIVDDANDRAFVSCTGANSVLQIDLAGNEIERIYHESTHPGFRLKSPLFLAFDTGGTVMVTPMVSGNNSIWGGSLNAGNDIHDLNDPAIAEEINGLRGLPDEDLFRIDPDAGRDGEVRPVARGLGTLLFGHGRNPASGKYWVLNTEALNKDPEKQSEPKVKGLFVANRLSTIENTLNAVDGPQPVAPQTQLIRHYSLDVGGLGGNLDADFKSIGQPYSLAFDSNGYGFISGLLTDNVVMLDQLGNYVRDWELPDGAIPRQVLLAQAAGMRLAFFYCWGDNRVREFRYDNQDVPEVTFIPVLQRTIDIGHDPTPPMVAAGREIFFDGDNSLNQNLSCASCHVEGGSDLLVWNLSNRPLDNKGGMLTQTMVGLERNAPFHWRGERSLRDFNPAFAGLLGGQKLTEGTPQAPQEFERFEQFVFSMVNPANPFQDRERVLNNDIHFVNYTTTSPDPIEAFGNAVDGQIDFRTKVSLQAKFTCNTCHSQPTGTGGDIHDEVPGISRPVRSHLKPAAFHELWRRQQSIVEVQLRGAAGPETRPFLGNGITHVGEFDDIYDFITGIVGQDPIGPDADAESIVNFVHQWDSGLAPAVHYTFLLDASTHAQADTELVQYLQNEASKRNCGIAVIGKARSFQGVLGETRWFWDRHAPGGGKYRSESRATYPDRDLLDFLLGAQTQGESHVFMGLPVGMSERWAVDYDLDGTYNVIDAASGPGNEYDPTEPPPSDTDPGPTFLIQPTIEWVTSKAVRLSFETDIPTVATVRYRRNTLGTLFQTQTRPQFSRAHTVVVTGLHPSTTTGHVGTPPVFGPVSMDYQFQVTVTARDGQQAASGPLAVTTDPHIEAEPAHFDPLNLVRDRQEVHEHLIESLTMQPLFIDKHKVVGQIDVRIAYKRGGDYDIGGNFTRFGAENRVVIGRPMKRDATTGEVYPVDFEGGLNALKVDDTVRLVDLPTGANGKPLFVDKQSAFLVPRGLTDSDGNLSFTFYIPEELIGENDSVLFNIEAVVEVPPDPTNATAWSDALYYVATHCPGPDCYLEIPSRVPGAQYAGQTENGQLSYSQWSAPDSGEANTTVEQIFLAQ